MRSTRNFPFLFILVTFTSCCKLLNCDKGCPPTPTPTACCDQAPYTPGLTGGNPSGLHNTTTISASDIAVLVERTAVTTINTDSWLLTTAIAVDQGNNSTKFGNTHALILLPADCAVKVVKALNADGSPAKWTQCDAYIDVELDQLDPDNVKMGPAATIEVELHRSEYAHSDGQPDFAVFAFSGMPDMRPDNNYWWWKNKHSSGLAGDPLAGSVWHPTAQPQPSRPIQ